MVGVIAEAICRGEWPKVVCERGSINCLICVDINGKINDRLNLHE